MPVTKREIDSEMVRLPHDFYHLQMAIVVVFEGDAQFDISPLTAADPATPERKESGWPVRGDGSWSCVLRQDIRDWLEKTYGPYSADGEYEATKLEDGIGLHFKNHRHAIAFKMTWL
jgi:hypothetical protein